MPDSKASDRYRAYALLAAVPLSAVTAYAEPVSFEDQVAPIVTKHCVVCHLPGGAQGELALYPDPWDATVNVESRQSTLLLVEPGKPETSYLYLKLTGEHLAAGGTGETMPSPQMPLAQHDIDTIRAWIAQGAGRN
jgi:mono/diheme cytochrome c family protein